MSKEVWAYTRTTTSFGIGDDILDKQIKSCEQYAANNDLKILSIYRDKISSERIKERFNEILNDMIEHNIDFLIVQNYARISRNILNLVEIEQTFDTKRKTIISTENKLYYELSKLFDRLNGGKEEMKREQ